MSAKIYVFRHTESQDNQHFIFSGGRNVPLSKNGYQQAVELAESLKDAKIDIAFSSNLIRAIDTLNIVLKYHPNVITCVDDRIRERSYGLLEGQSKKTWAKYAYPLFKVFHRSYLIPPPGGESLRMVQKRVHDFIDELIEYLKNNNMNAIISAHSGSIRGIRQRFENVPDKDFNSIETDEGELFIYNL